ncbi:hypothetical protein F4813DRAFT_400799 [Daldinia decipiens]|uniref:uncharacterized protein n=1 Tax=Daldinia decipiens TaxID=326647 RepID=UPI0020C27B0B|nr:uncharacterized protein F4813DRAFT_400799 [Daldinia decipiens]KAI1652734.1 hypothetical protein F4813DRAFT_400799 [Daldinia decipiens]
MAEEPSPSRRLDNGTALEALFLMTVDMAKEWHNHSVTPSSKTVKSFEEDMEKVYNDFRVLFHASNREKLQSLLPGMFPHDLYGYAAGYPPTKADKRFIYINLPWATDDVHRIQVIPFATDYLN